MVEVFLENGPMLHFHHVSKKTQCMVFWCVNFSTSSIVWCTQLQLRASIWQLIDVFLLRSMESFHRHKCFSFTEEEASVQRSTATKWKWFDILDFYRPRKKPSTVALCSENIVGSGESHLHFHSVQIASTHVRANSEKLNGTISKAGECSPHSGCLCHNDRFLWRHIVQDWDTWSDNDTARITSWKDFRLRNKDNIYLVRVL